MYISELSEEPEMEISGSFISHKFTPLDSYCWDSLELSTLYFSAPEKLNDPADCQIDLGKAFRLARVNQQFNYSHQEEQRFLNFARKIENIAKTCGVFSLCSGSIDGDKERLLWAHYAKNHTGICLTYKIPSTFVIEHLIGCAKVEYTPDALYDALRKLNILGDPDFETEIKPIVTAFLTTKSPEWAYENESRLISFSPGLQACDRSWLSQICFGLRTSDEDRARVQELAANYPNCNLVEAVNLENDLFRLTLRNIS